MINVIIYQKRVYLYRLCMFNDIQQISNSRDRVIIGYFNSWSGETNNKYLQMKHSNGDVCSNGQSRSLTVTFRCGIENRIVDVQEPTKCKYTMIFETSISDKTITKSKHHEQDEL